ncbi:hypothetical protein PSPO01_07386 [Paraphaeosphaeria sporulosa]
MNNEAKTRRKEKSNIVGRSRVMTWEDIEIARAKRAEQEAAIEAKGKQKRGRKPKRSATTIEEPLGTTAESAEASRVVTAQDIMGSANGQRKYKRVRHEPEEATARVASKTSEIATKEAARAAEVQAIG